MNKILVAGAGHGGITAAIHLAKNGYDVTVVEMENKEDLGHDWHDALDMSAFDGAGLPRPEKGTYTTGMRQGFRNPSKTVTLKMELGDDSMLMDRKILIAYLIDLAEKVGVKFLFNHKIIAPLIEGAAVRGLLIEKDGIQKEIEADLTIDAAGLYSPVRMNLPEECGIQNEIDDKNIFHVYRAYFRNLTGETIDPPYSINLFHMNRPGIDWTVTEKEFVDILIGKFGMAGKLTQQEVDDTLQTFRQEYPFIGEEVIRGGVFADIPLTKMLPLIVCDGYVAVGDSAGMTVPLTGSGIILSMKAGKILADTVMKSCSYLKKSLWPYQYEYYQTLGKDLILINTVKNFFTYVTGQHVDYFLEKGILTEKQLAFGGSGELEITADYLLHVITSVMPLYKLFPPLLKTVKMLPFLPLICDIMPKDYDEEKVNKWINLYNKI